METTEALGYLKGLVDGLDLDSSSKETKVFKAIIEVLENLNEDVLDMTEEIDLVEEQLDDIDDDLATVEEYLFDDDEFDCDGDCEGCDGCDFDDEYDDEYEDFEIQCPNCETEFLVDEETVMQGSVECPNCGEVLSLEVEFDEEEDAE